MSSLFISYSRKDIEAAHRLTEAFKKQDLDFWIDWEGIPPTVDWWKEIEKGIEEADVFLCLVSPASAASPVCKKEIEHAARNGKRLVPVIVRDIDGQQAPPELGHLNWIFLRDCDDFEQSFGKLITAIHTDYDWVQVHRQLQVKALEWERNNHENSFLLRGVELQHAEFQLEANAAKQPQATDLQRQYLERSRQLSNRQRRTTYAAVLTAGIALAVLAVFGWLQAVQATTNAHTAQTQQAFAQAQSTLAIRNESTAQAASTQAVEQAQEARHQAQIANTSNLGAVSLQLPAGEHTTSLLLAIEAMRAAEGMDRPPVQVEQAIWAAMLNTGGVAVPAGELVSSDIVFLDNQHFLTAHPDGIRMWTYRNGKLSASNLSYPAGAETLAGPADMAISPDRRWLAICIPGSIKVWDLREPQSLPLTRENEQLFGKMQIQFTPDSQLLIVSDEYATLAWQTGDWSAEPLSLDGNLVAENRVFDIPIPANDQENQVRTLGTGFGASPIMTSVYVIPVTGGGGPPEKLVPSVSNTSFQNQMFATANFGSIQIWDRKKLDAPRASIRLGLIQPMVFEALVNDHWLASVLYPYYDREIAEPLLLFYDYTRLPRQALFTRLPGRRINQDLLPVMHPSGQWLAVPIEPVVKLPGAAYQDGSIAIVDFAEPTDPSFSYVAPHDTQVTRMAFDPTGYWLASGDAAGTILLSRFNTYGYTGETRKLIGHDGQITGLAFSPDGWTLVSADEHGRLRLWDVSPGSEKLVSWPQVVGDATVVNSSIRFSPDGRYLAAGQQNGDVVLREVGDLKGPSLRFSGGFSEPAHFLAFDPSNRWLAAANFNGKVTVWSLEEPGKPVLTINKDNQVYDMTFSQDGKWLFTASYQGLRRWDIATGKDALLYPGGNGRDVHSLQWAGGGRWLIGLTGYNTLVIWDTSLPGFAKVLTVPDVYSFATDPRSEWYLFRSKDQVSLATPEKTIPLPGQGSYWSGTNLALSPDMQYAAAVSNNTILVWEQPLEAPQPLILAAADMYANPRLFFSSDNRWLLADDSTQIKLWDTQNLRAAPITLPRLRGTMDLRLDPSGQKMALLDRWGVITLWEMDLSRQLDLACQVVGRNLTQTEWLTYFPGQPYRPTCPQWPPAAEETEAIIPP